MKKIFTEKSSMISKLFIFQVAMSLLGLFVVSPFTANSSLCLAAGIFSMLFYFSLITYAVIEDGQKEYISVKAGRCEFSVFTGFLYALVSYIPTIILTVVYMIMRLSSPDSIITGAKAVLNIIIRFFLMGMYLGIDVKLRADGAGAFSGFISENGIFYVMCLVLMPVICGISYALAYNGKIHVNTESKKKK